MTFVDLRPDHLRPVQVLVDGTWRGFVRWSDGPGQPNYLGWYAEHQLRTSP